MAIIKKTPATALAEAVKETKAVEASATSAKKETTAATTKTAEKSTKTTAAKTTKPKAPAKKTTAKKDTAKVEVFVEFNGVKVSVDEIVKNVKITNGKDAKSYTIYVKPDESKAYFVADGESKEMDVFFC